MIPHPDPAPGARARQTIVPYTIILPAVSKATGKIVPGYKFRCRVHVNGERKCVLFKR
jgi:hypothetical protein